MVLLRDEVGLDRQPKVAQLLAQEILELVEETYLGSEVIKPGQILIMAPERGQGPSWVTGEMEKKNLKTVVLDMIIEDDIERIVGGDSPMQVRKDRLVRLVKQAFDQGVCLSTCQLGILCGISPVQVHLHFKAHTKQTGEVLPSRGIIEDYGPAVSHKADIVARHLAGETTSEIARSTCHTPRSVERYIGRFEQVRDLVRYVEKTPNPALFARILGCSQRLVEEYLELLPAREHSV
jgi:hypothetical protein